MTDEIENRTAEVDDPNAVYVLETEYTNGYHEINGVFHNRSAAEKMAEFIKKNDGLNDFFVKRQDIHDFYIM